jgi:lipopolysaccharide exporter
VAGLDQKVLGGVAWMILFRVVERVLGLVSTLILVRLLVPADFGLVAMAVSIIAVVEIMGALGFDTVLIQRQDAARSHYDTAWTFNVIVSSCVAIGLVLLSIPAAWFYDEPRLTPVILLLAVGSWIGGFENIGVVDFRKSLRFDKEFGYLLTKRLVSFVTIVPLAFALRDYWALAIGTVIAKIGTVVASFVWHPYRPRLSLQARHDLFSFSKWLFLNNLTLLTRDRSADFAIGRLLGPHDLGLYTVSNEVASLPQQFTAPVNRAVFPAYAKHGNDSSQLGRAFLQVTALLWLMALPAGVGICLISPVLVPVVLGPNWVEAAPLLSILAVAATLMVMQDNIAYVFFALGTPRVTTFLTLGYVALFLPLLVILTARSGATGAAWAHLLTALIFIPASLAVIFRRLHLRPSAFGRDVWRILVSVAAMGAAVSSLLSGLSTAGTLAQHWILAVCVSVGAVVYAACVVLLWWLAGRPDGAERLIFNYLAERLGGRRVTE